jgi:AGCS family alanine or glycine:cation symporter
VKRIAKFTEFIVPIMAIYYCCNSYCIDFDQLPVISFIFKSAFNMEAGFGAVFGLAIQWGVKRGIYSNEAGQISSTYCGSKCFTSHHKTRFGAAFRCISIRCSMLSNRVYVIITGKYNVQNPNLGQMEHQIFIQWL